MENELLNEYLFADLVVDYADTMRRVRVGALVKSGALQEGSTSSEPITSQDMKAGFQRLEQRRREALALLQESRGEAEPRG